MAWQNAIMNTTLTVDKAGRVVLPKPVRDQLQLAAGDLLELESSNDSIVLRPVRETVGLRKKQGIWVLDTDEPPSAEMVHRTVRDIRREREDRWLANPPTTSEGNSSGKARKRQ
jgi:AbrB family looped-hinge helix DNA binding protein